MFIWQVSHTGFIIYLPWAKFTIDGRFFPAFVLVDMIQAVEK